MRTGDGLMIALFVAAAPVGAEALAAQAGAESLVREQYLMGTRLWIEAQGPDRPALERATSRAFAEVARLEGILSNWREDSELSRLNREPQGRPASVSPDLFEALRAAEALARRTGGAFDPTVEPLVRAYDLRGGGRAPAKGELLAALEAVGIERGLALDERSRTAKLDRAQIDLGGIGKGIAIDRAVAILREEGIASALVNFGGEVYALGERAPGEAWEVEIADPRDRGRAIARLRVRDAAVSTSGQSERSVEAGGKRIGHILDPRTGASVRPWGSATAIAPTATEADGISTALFVMGPEEARRWTAGEAGLLAVTVEAEPRAESIPDAQTAGALRVRTAGSLAAVEGIELLADATSPADTSPLADAEAADDAPARAAPPADPQSGGRPAEGHPPAEEASGGDAPSNAELARRIDILAAEMETMKLGAVAGAGEGAYGLGPGASKVYHAPPGVSIGGYGEMLYQNFAGEREDDAPSGRLDRIDYLRAIVYAGYKYSDRIVFNSEIEFEHASTGQGGSVSVEFAHLDFLLDPLANVRAGLVLLPIGLTNELHEPPIFLGARRADVEQQVIPSTWRANGVGIFGETPGGLSYRAYLTEGLRGERFDAASGIRGGRQSGSEAIAEDPAVSARLDYEGIPGLLVGGSIYTGNSGAGAVDSLGSEIDAGTTLFEIHGQYQGHGLRLRALHAQVSIDEVERLNALAGHEGGSSIGERIVGTTLEAGYDVLTLLEPGATDLSLVPYVRYEWLNTQEEVPDGFAANPANERAVLTLGAAFYPHPQVVLKTDFQKRTNEAETGIDQLNVAVGYLF